MSNIINVKEQKNILSFTGNIIPVVANSANFYLKFDLDEEWSDCTIVTVMFHIGGKLQPVELDENDECQIPPTNGDIISFSLRASIGENQTISSSVLTLDIVQSGESDLSNIEVYEYVHRELLGVLEDLENGDLTAQNAINAGHATTANTSLSQVSLTGDESILGTKNFTGTLQKNGAEVASIAEISNPNLLINGDFRVNQRGVSNPTAGRYCFDRWICWIPNSTIAIDDTANCLKIVVNGTADVLQQIMEDEISKRLYGKTLTLSAEVSSDGVNFSKYSVTRNVTSQFGASDVTIVGGAYLTQGTNASGKVYAHILTVNNQTLYVRYIKLEIGDHATPFSPRLYGEELALCQRYYQMYSGSNSYSSIASGITFSSNAIVNLSMPCKLRTPPTVSVSGQIRMYVGNNSFTNIGVTGFTISGQGMCNNSLQLQLNYTGSSFTVGQPTFLRIDGSGSYLSLDAEIY